MKLLCFARDPYPNERPDLFALFGRYLRRRGIVTHLVAQRRDGGRGYRGVWGGGCLEVVGRTARWRALNPLLVLAGSLAALRRHRDIDALQVRDSALIGVLALCAARLGGRPFYYWMSFPFPEGFSAMAATHRAAGRSAQARVCAVRAALASFALYRCVVRYADHVFVQSERMREWLVARGVSADKLTPVPMGVDLETMNSPPAPVHDSRFAGRRVIVYLGVLDRIRRPDILLDALARLRTEFPTVLLLLVGDASEAADSAWLDTRARELGVDDAVVKTGNVPMQEAWRYVMAAEIGLSPIPRGVLFDVSSPTKVLEYMALGLPVIATDIPDTAQVLAESGAGIVTAFDPEAFAGAIATLLRDPEPGQRMAAAGPPYIAAQRSYERIASSLASTYEALRVSQGCAPTNAASVGLESARALDRDA